MFSPHIRLQKSGEIMYCPKCYKLNPDENKFCAQCGHPLTEQHEGAIQQGDRTKYCMHCGSEIMAAAIVCPKCGCKCESYKHSEDKASVIFDIVAILCPIIGLVMYFVFHHNYPVKAKSVGIASIVGFLVYLLFPYIVTTIASFFI